MGGERGLDLPPVLRLEHAAGERHDLALLLAHVLPVPSDEPLGRFGERRELPIPTGFVAEERLLEVADRALAPFVLAAKLVEDRTALARTPADHREQHHLLFRVDRKSVV